MVAGLLEPDGGEVHVHADHAFGFQDARLVPWLRVWDNITLGMAGGSSLRRQLAERALARVQLAHVADAMPCQMQRVSLARALVREPNLLLLDEPFGALDALTRWDMQDLLIGLRGGDCSRRFAAIMVTHDIGEALRLSDRILVLRDGGIHDEVVLDRSTLDDQGRPQGYEMLERRLHEALHAG